MLNIFFIIINFLFGFRIRRRNNILNLYRSFNGYRIYIIADPTKAPEERAVIGYANEQEACTVIARRNGFLFVITESGQRGWVAAEYIVYEY